MRLLTVFAEEIGEFDDVFESAAVSERTALSYAMSTKTKRVQFGTSRTDGASAVPTPTHSQKCINGRRAVTSTF